MIITQTPLRIGLIGGGTDLPAYSERYGGLTLSAAIDKYIYVIVRRRFDDDIHPGTGNVDSRQLVEDSIHLGDDNAVVEGRGFDNDRCVFGVGAGEQIAICICRLRANQRDAGGQVDEIAAKEFQIGVDSTDLNLAG